MTRRWRLRLGISLTSVLFVLSVLEFSIRLWDHQLLTARNFVFAEIAILHSEYPMVFDSALGWVPRPNAVGTAALWGRAVTISILPDGTRSNGAADGSLDAHPLVLAVGDSFTFGDEVADNETWPAWLQQRLHAHVINGGVVGYGLDQTYLRARLLTRKYQPDILIVSFIADDIKRLEFSERHHAEKPYFDIVGGALVEKNAPVPPPHAHHSGVWLRESLGYSLLADRLMTRLAPAFWFDASNDSIRVHHRADEVACLLMRELARLATETHVREIVLAQDELSEPSPLACLDRNALETVELAPALKREEANDPQGFRRTFFHTAHMSSHGNQFVADELFKQIRPDRPRDRSGARRPAPT